MSFAIFRFKKSFSSVSRLKKLLFSETNYRILTDQSLYEPKSHEAYEHLREFMQLISSYENTWVASIFSEFKWFYKSDVYIRYKELKKLNFFLTENDWGAYAVMNFLAVDERAAIDQIINSLYSVLKLDRSFAKYTLKLIISRSSGVKLHSIAKAIELTHDCWLKDNKDSLKLLENFFAAEKEEEAGAVNFACIISPLIKANLFNTIDANQFKILKSPYLPGDLRNLLSLMQSKDLLASEDGIKIFRTFMDLLQTDLFSSAVNETIKACAVLLDHFTF